MVHEQWNKLMIIAAIFATAVTVTGTSCHSSLYAVYAVAGILTGGGLAWVRDRTHRDDE